MTRTFTTTTETNLTAALEGVERDNAYDRAWQAREVARLKLLRKAVFVGIVASVPVWGLFWAIWTMLPGSPA